MNPKIRKGLLVLIGVVFFLFFAEYLAYHHYSIHTGLRLWNTNSYVIKAHNRAPVTSPIIEQTVFAQNRTLMSGGQKTFLIDHMSHIRHRGYMYQDIKPNTKYLFYTCAGSRYCGGWGDRLRAVLPLNNIAKCLKRKYGIFMHRPIGCLLEKVMEPNEVNWMYDPDKLVDIFEKEPQRVVTVRFFMSNMTVTTHEGENVTTFTKFDFNGIKQDIVVIVGNWKLFGHSRGNAFLKQCLGTSLSHESNAVNQSYHELFKLPGHLKRRMDVIRHPEHTLICAHVRMRRNPSNPRDAGSINSLSTTKSLFDLLKSKMKNSTKTLMFVMSDSSDVIDEAKANFGDKLISVDGPIIHIDRDRDDRDCSGLQKLILEFSILNTCDVIVKTQSGISTYGAAIGKPGKEVYFFKNGTITGPTKM